MSQISPFYENRNQTLDFHVWKHPNYPLHLHKHLELVYNAGGTVTVVVAGKECVLRQGDCAIVFPYQIHSYASEGEVELCFVIADMEAVGEFGQELTEYVPESPFFGREELSEYGKRLLDLVLLSARDKEENYQLEKGLLIALLAEIFRTLPLVPKKSNADLSMAQKLLRYINDNIRQELSAKEVAKELGISPYYLSHIFSEQLQISFPAYIAGQRLILACDMLKNTGKSITEIVYESGFTNMRTFHRCFQRKFGCTPGEWRQKLC